ncbi:MAG: TraR/DksA family transcriptional regulator [Kiritimatiellae bacterium]|nr:TraR/DksA family transcriptional regulator [Kiritimatiellia bacterium]
MANTKKSPAEGGEHKKSVRKGPPPKIAKKPPPPASIPPDKAEEDRAFAFSFAERRKQARHEREANAVKEEEIKLSRRPTSRTKGTKSQQFPQEDLDQFKASLLALRDSITDRSGELKRVALEQTDDRGSEDDDGSDAFARLQSLGQVDLQNRTVARIDEALRRIEDGSYGVCEVCGKLIRKPRLLNLPFVHTCMECQNEMEKTGERK